MVRDTGFLASKHQTVQTNYGDNSTPNPSAEYQLAYLHSSRIRFVGSLPHRSMFWWFGPELEERKPPGPHLVKSEQLCVVGQQLAVDNARSGSDNGVRHAQAVETSELYRIML
jgi:hypothetical protein